MIRKIFISFALLCTAFFCYKRFYTEHKKTFTIAILQTASHPALDEARIGFEKAFKEYKSDVTYVYYNGQGSAEQLYSMAQRISADDDVCALYALGTPAALACASTEKIKPVVVAAITNHEPFKDNTNVFGVSDMPDIASHIAYAKKLFPFLKTIGTVYNSSENNSVFQIEKMKASCENNCIEIICIGINQESELPQAIEMLCRKSDCIFCPLDNMVASGMNIITKIAYQKKKPVFAFDNELLNKGVLATRGIEYRECGKKAADILYKALFENGAYEFSQTGNTKIFINQELWHYYELSETLKEN